MSAPLDRAWQRLSARSCGGTPPGCPRDNPGEEAAQGAPPVGPWVQGTCASAVDASPPRFPHSPFSLIFRSSLSDWAYGEWWRVESVPFPPIPVVTGDDNGMRCGRTENTMHPKANGESCIILLPYLIVWHESSSMVLP
jgi:hypothetical protein